MLCLLRQCKQTVGLGLPPGTICNRLNTCKMVHSSKGICVKRFDWRNTFSSGFEVPVCTVLSGMEYQGKLWKFQTRNVGNMTLTLEPNSKTSS